MFTIQKCVIIVLCIIEISAFEGKCDSIVMKIMQKRLNFYVCYCMKTRKEEKFKYINIYLYIYI